MSQAPFAVRNVRFGTTLGASYAFEDTLWAGLSDSYCGLPMGMTAEKLGAQFGITRDEVDNFALQSQQRWKKCKLKRETSQNVLVSLFQWLEDLQSFQIYLI